MPATGRVPAKFFADDARLVARRMVGLIIRRRHRGLWLAAMIIETEAYMRSERGSHASLGRTPSREALFMAPGTIYMYYARGGDSLNVSCGGEGDAVLVKSAYPYVDEQSPRANVALMQRLNPKVNGGRRTAERLCAGQTLLCRALSLRVPDWNGKPFDDRELYLEQKHPGPVPLIEAPRLGIPQGRDEHLLYRFVHREFTRHATQNPLTKRSWHEGTHYHLL